MGSLLLSQQQGSYLLWFYLPRGCRIDVGRLGRLDFKRGWYLYCGSAFGPGGLRARLGHHLKPSARLHWHIDYLKEKASLRSIWYCCGVNNEHDWSEKLATLARSERPFKGFGASDCSCFSHLVYVPKRPRSAGLSMLLEPEGNIYRRNMT